MKNSVQRLKGFLLPLISAAVISSLASAQSTIDRTWPPDNLKPVSAQAFRTQFGKAANDIEALQIAPSVGVTTGPLYSQHGLWRLNARKETGIDPNDESFQLGYNLYGEKLGEPSLYYGLESDYTVTAQGRTNVRSLETYISFNGGHGGIGMRPLFCSAVPGTSGNGFTNYCYMGLGPNLQQTIGGGGFQFITGDPGTGTNGEGTTKFAVDREGNKLANLQLFNDTYADPITVSSTSNMTIALPSGRGSEFSVGTLVGLYQKTGPGTWSYNTTPVATCKVTSIATDTLTTNCNNSTNTVTSSMVAKKVFPPAYTSSTDCAGFGTTCDGTSQERVKIAGNMSQIGSMYIQDVGAAPSGFGSGSVLNFSKSSTNYQVMSFANGSQGYAMGYANGNNATFCFGPAQTPDTNFNSANSVWCGTVGGGVGVGGTNTSNVAFLRVVGTDAAHSSLWLNDQTDSSTSCFDAGAGVHLCSVNGVLKVTPHGGQPRTINGSGSTQRVTPTTGSTITAAAANQKILIVPSGTLAALTVKFPASPINEQVFEIVTTQTITALTLQNSDASGLTSLPALTSGAFGTLNAGTMARWFYSSTDAAWIRIQ